MIFSFCAVLAQSNEKSSATRTVSDKSQNSEKVFKKEHLKAVEQRSVKAKRIDGVNLLTREQMEARTKERSGKAKTEKNEEK